MKKLLILLLTLLMVLSFTGCKKPDKPDVIDGPNNMNNITTDVQTSFNNLQRQWFIEELTDDFLNQHFSLENPESVGMSKAEVTWGDLDSEDDSVDWSSRLAQLTEYKLEDLTEDQQIMYQSMKFYFEIMEKDQSIEEEYTFLFTPNSGLNNNLITNITEFDLRNQQDAEDLIVIVKDAARYIDQAIARTQKQADNGIIQIDTVIDKIIEQCQRFIGNVDSNEVIKVFSSRVDDLKLDKAVSDGYKAEMTSAVKEYLIPAYQRIIDFYKGMKGKSTATGLLADLPNGKDTYELLVKYKASTDESIPDLIKKMENAIDDTIKDILAIKNFSFTDSYGFDDPYKILSHIQTKMASDFPAIPDVEYTVDYLDESVVSENVSAYYLIAPFDNVRRNVIKVNPLFVQNHPDGICITLAHEGYPGHLFHHAYYFSTHPNNEYRYNMNFLGYGEGWAQYVETLAYGYFLNNSREVEYMQLNNLFGYYLYGYCDLRMHYDGWKESDIEKFLSQYLNPDYTSSYAESIYASNVGDPALFLPYSLGLYEMWDLYKTTKDTLGNNFNLKEYNTVVMDTGEAPFPVLKQRVQKYIEEKK